MENKISRYNMKNQSTTKGFAILSATGLICKILSLVYIPVQTAIVHDYGNNIISAGYRIYIFMFSLANAGLPSSISKMVSEQDAKGNYKGSRKILKYSAITLFLLSSVFSLCLIFGAGSIAREIRQPETYLMLITFAPVFIFTAVNCALRGYFQGKKNMMPTAVSQIIEQAVNTFFTAFLIYIFFFYTGRSQTEKYTNAAAGYAMGTLAGAIGASIFLIYIYMSTRHDRYIEEKNSGYDGPMLTRKRIIKQIIRYSIPALIGSIATSAPDLLDTDSCIKRMMAGGISEVMAKNINGRYTTAYQRTLSISTFVATALMTALIPAISAAYSMRDKKMLKHEIDSSYKALFIFMVPCLMGLTVLSKPIVYFIFFNVRQGGYEFLTAWSWSNILYGIITIQSAILIGLGRPVEAPLNLIIGMVFKYFLNRYLISIPWMNMHGAAIGSAVGWFISVVLNEYSIRKYAKLKTRFSRLIYRPLIFSAVMGGAAVATFELFSFVLKYAVHTKLLVNDISLIAAIFVAVYVYAFMIIKSKTLRKNEILRLPMGSKLMRVFQKLRFV